LQIWKSLTISQRRSKARSTGWTPVARMFRQRSAQYTETRGYCRPHIEVRHCRFRSVLTLVDIDRSIEVIEQFRAPLDRRDEEEKILRSDPRKVGISEYISSLERLDRDLRRLQGSNLAANQNSIRDGSALLKYGIRQLEDLFKQTLLATGSGGQIEPLHYITKGINTNYLRLS
jgi:hypothetical protein